MSKTIYLVIFLLLIIVIVLLSYKTKSKKKFFAFFIIFFIFLSSLLFYTVVVSINNASEGWQMDPNTQYINLNDPLYHGMDIISPGIKKNIKRLYGNYGSIFIPTKTDSEFNSFCNNASNAKAYCTDCNYSSWTNYDCLSSGIWQQTRTSTVCYSEYMNTSNSCNYCSKGSTCSTYGSYTSCCNVMAGCETITAQFDCPGGSYGCPSGYSCQILKSTSSGCNIGYVKYRPYCTVPCSSQHNCP